MEETVAVEEARHTRDEEPIGPAGYPHTEEVRPAVLNPFSLLAAALFILSGVLGFLGSPAWFVLFIPALFLTLMGMRGTHASQAARNRGMARTGSVLVFNGIVLILSLFIVGFIRDFLQAHPGVLDSQVALVLTVVHVMLGVGLLLLDLRHAVSPRVAR